MNDAQTNHAANDNGVAASSPLSLSDRVRSLRLPERPAGSEARGSWLPWVLCLLLGGVTGYLAFTRPVEDPAYKEYLDLKNSGVNPLEVELQAKTAGDPARPDPGKLALTSKGYIIPISLIQVSPKVGGMVMKLYITEGMAVKKDFLLAELEETEYKADFDRALAATQAAEGRYDELWKYRKQEVRQVKAEFDDAKAQRDQLFQEYSRSLGLKNANALAQKDFEQAESAYKSMEFRTERLRLAFDLLEKGPRDERIASAKAEWEQAKAELSKAEWRLGNTKVKAPIDGIILSKKAEEGNQINPAAFSNGLSASLCEMADLTKMEVDLAIAERDIGKVFDGQECQVRAEAFPERTYKGVVTRRMPTADRSKGAVPVRVQIFIPPEEAGQYLRPEMGAVVTFFNKK